MSLEPYLDSGGVWTIGGGVTSHDGVRINRNTTPLASVKEAVDQYKEKLKPYIASVDKYTTSAQARGLTQEQFDALVSFHYNTGAIAKATLTKVVNADPRNHERVKSEFMKWVNDNGKKIPGLVTRRTREARLYTSGVYNNTNGRVNLFPVSAKTHSPIYKKGTLVDVSGYFEE